MPMPLYIDFGLVEICDCFENIFLKKNAARLGKLEKRNLNYTIEMVTFVILINIRFLGTDLTIDTYIHTTLYYHCDDTMPSLKWSGATGHVLLLCTFSSVFTVTMCTNYIKIMGYTI